MSINDWQTRTALLLGETALGKLAGATVAVFGLGGVGGHAAEALARAGVGHLVLIDCDTYQASNLNRQIGALTTTLGRGKAAVMADRVRDINPAIEVQAIAQRYHPDTADSFPLARWDFIIDAIDMVTAKIELISRATAAGVPMVSVMGTGWKRDPGRLCRTDLDKTHSCPLARVMRRELGQRGIRHIPVVWSDEPPARPQGARQRGDPPGSLPWVPATAGLMAAAYAVERLCGQLDGEGA